MQSTLIMLLVRHREGSLFEKKHEEDGDLREDDDMRKEPKREKRKDEKYEGSRASYVSVALSEIKDVLLPSIVALANIKIVEFHLF